MYQLITNDGEVMLINAYNGQLPNGEILGPVKFTEGILDTIIVQPSNMSYVKIDKTGAGLSSLLTQDFILTGNLKCYIDNNGDLIPYALWIKQGPAVRNIVYPIIVQLANLNSIPAENSHVEFAWMKSVKIGQNQIPLFAIGHGVSATKCLVFNNSLSGPTYNVIDLTSNLKGLGSETEISLAIPNITVDLTEQIVDMLSADIETLTGLVDNLEATTAEIEQITDSVKSRYVNR